MMHQYSILKVELRGIDVFIELRVFCLIIVILNWSVVEE